MFRVAVIQNESEMLRSGYANVASRLRSVPKLSDYSFEVFNAINLAELLDNAKSLLRFDALVITTNATSDKTVLQKLRNCQSVVAEFLENGKGVFIASQKKLSATPFKAKNDRGGLTGFLPAEYEFRTIERPSTETDSGEGEIVNLPTGTEADLLLSYPNNVSSELVMHHCLNNEFRRHLYRSHIEPLSTGRYVPILVDTSYEAPAQRNLLMTNFAPVSGERMVITTIALDWEFHEGLLINIIRHITEGPPRIAFIDKGERQHDDFDFILSSARLSKVSHEVYSSLGDIRADLIPVHNTYIFSPGWTETDFEPLVARAERAAHKNRTEREYLRIYYFRQIREDLLTLSQYSNFSTFDLMIDSALLWINSKFEGSMWGSSFWTTYDILMTLHDVGFDFTVQFESIERDLRKHYKNNSYDEVIGATCGLLDLLVMLVLYHPETLRDTTIGASDIPKIINWITSRFDTLSNQDRQTAFLSLSDIRNNSNKLGTCGLSSDCYEEISERVRAGADFSDVTTLSEMDICRLVSVSLQLKSKPEVTQRLIEHLQNMQAPDGSWINVGRTARVLVFLLETLDVLKHECEGCANIDDLIYNGVTYIRAEFDSTAANWDDDLQATAKAVHCLGLYNEKYAYSTQDFLKTIGLESEKMYSAAVVRNVSESIRRLRSESEALFAQVEKARSSHAEKLTENRALERRIEEYEFFENANENEVKRARAVAWLLIPYSGLVTIYLLVKYPARILQEVQKIDFLSAFIGIALGVVFTYVWQKTVLKSELLRRRADARRQDELEGIDL